MILSPADYNVRDATDHDNNIPDALASWTRLCTSIKASELNMQMPLMSILVLGSN